MSKQVVNRRVRIETPNGGRYSITVRAATPAGARAVARERIASMGEERKGHRVVPKSGRMI